MVQNRAENAFFIYLIEPSKPVICPSHTQVVNRYVPVNRYYYQHTTDQETQCPGSAGNTNIGMNTNNFGM